MPIPVPKGVVTLEVSTSGMQAKCDRWNEGASASLRFRMETLIMQEAVVSADVVIAHQWRFPRFRANQRGIGRDLPLVLNTTPESRHTARG